MSFLYKALLKEQQKDQQNEQQKEPQKISTAAPHSQWENETNPSSFVNGNTASFDAFQAQGSHQHSNSGWSVGAWVVIALLLLVVGGLSGYIAGNVFGLSSNNSVNNTQVPQTIQPVPTQSELLSNQAQANDNSEIQQPAPKKEVEADYEFKQGKLTEVNTNQLTTESLPTDTSAVKSEEPIAKNIAENIEPIRIEEMIPSTSIDEVPDELKAAFEQAVADLDAAQQDPLADFDRGIQVETDSTLTDINDLSNQERAALPQIFYQMHIFASEPSQRWIKVNDKTLHEGEYLTKNLKLVEIRQDVVVWETTYRRFSQVALQDYK